MNNLEGHGVGGFTGEGGLFVRLINDTGAPSVKGTLVCASQTADLAFEVTGADDAEMIGVVYEDDVADGELCGIVISGPAQVLLQDTTASTHGNWARCSITTAGRADCTNATAPGHGIGGADIHFHEIGHCLETQGAGVDVLAWVSLHFN